MKDLQIEDDLIVAGGLYKDDTCPEGMHLCITSSQSPEPPCCD